MNSFESLVACAGSWTGTNTLHDPMSGKPEVTASTLTGTPVLRGTFARVDYTWSYQDAPQEGSFLIGFDPKAGTLSIHWIDSWHNGRSVMKCAGPADESGTMTMLGSFAAPSGPDWGWRIAIEPRPGSAIRIDMTNISPEGEEYPAVEATYSPA
ncbi:MAG TPA: DUF1579 family protein [Longimicrobium sp.]